MTKVHARNVDNRMHLISSLRCINHASCFFSSLGVLVLNQMAANPTEICLALQRFCFLKFTHTVACQVGVWWVPATGTHHRGPPKDTAKHLLFSWQRNASIVTHAVAKSATESSRFIVQASGDKLLPEPPTVNSAFSCHVLIFKVTAK